MRARYFVGAWLASCTAALVAGTHPGTRVVDDTYYDPDPNAEDDGALYLVSPTRPGTILHATIYGEDLRGPAFHAARAEAARRLRARGIEESAAPWRAFYGWLLGDA